MNGAVVNADSMTCRALLNCLIREVSGPEQQAWEADGHLVIRLARSGVVLRAVLGRPSAGIGPRPAGPAEVRAGTRWQAVGPGRLAGLIAAELTLATGTVNPEFADQVTEGRTALAAILRARAPGRGAVGVRAGRGSGHDRGARCDPVEAYLASEQALICGHRFHPAPKARSGRPADWLRYAPEAGARFPLRFLAVREDVLAAEGETAGLDRLGGPVPPAGYRLLPAHPWQLRLLADRPWLVRARAAGLVVDLGDGSREVVPTSSVRTVYDPAADVFAKFSLNVRITNCVRTSAWYELAGAVTLTRLLGPVFTALAGEFPGTVLLGEPGYRTVALAAKDGYEGLAVIVRDGVRTKLAPQVTPLLAAALTEPDHGGPEHAGPGRGEPGAGGAAAGEPAAGEPGAREGSGWLAGLLAGREPDGQLAWWQAYVRTVAPPVLGAFFSHGVVLEPHLQNVLVGVDRDGWPVQAVFRDLEGTKLVASRHAALLRDLPAGVARGLAYDASRGWDRVAYCLLVNHLAEVAAALADRSPQRAFERELWRRAGQVLAEAAAEHGWPPQLRAVLAGVPLPAKANLRVRWARGADREAAYVPVPNPLRTLEPA